MRNFSKFVVLGLLFTASALAETGKKHEPLPVPTNIRVSSSAPREQLWEKLSHQEKKFAYHMIEAARAGRTILFLQNHRHGLVIKALLEEAFSRKHIEDTKALLGQQAFTELLSYGTKFQDLAGPYEGSNRKYILSKVTPAQVEELFAVYADKVAPAVRREVVALLTDASYEVIQMPEDELGTGLETAGGNNYEKGITGAEVAKALKEAGLKSCLSCRVVRSATGGLTVEPYTTSSPGAAGEALRKVARELRLALPYAATDHQKDQLRHLVRFLESGDVEAFRQSNISWVRDATHSKVDFMMGFVEVYQDYLAQIGSWESYVQIVDPVMTDLSVRLARNAQYFENAMPYGEFKKTFPADYSPPALMVYYFQEIASMRSGGYNLPNFDDIRRDVGAKNIIRLSLPGEEVNPEVRRLRREMLEEFLPAALVDRAIEHHDASWQTLVLLHEIIGHGSGTYDTTKYGKTEDPISALGALGSALEEQRADLTALVFGNDPKLVEVGLYKSQAESDLVRDVMYDMYLVDFLRHTSKERTFSEAHQRGNWLLVNLLIERGAVAWTAKDGSATVTPENGVLVVRDYKLFQDVSRELLGELQRIKANRDEAAMRKLFAEKAPLDAIQQPWAQALIERGGKLALNAGAVEQPWRVSSKGQFRLLCEKLLLEEAAMGWKHQ